jgi:hypothetical protein
VRFSKERLTPTSKSMVKIIGFRCPDDLVAQIERQQEVTGQDKTTVTISMLRGLPGVEVDTRKSFPPVEATYLVWAQGKLLYIGHTDNLHDTFLTHPRLVEFLNVNARVAWFDCEGVDRLEVESGVVELFGAQQ